MKILMITLCASALIGCGCKTTGTYSFPLEREEKVYFNTQERANEFRALSGNEPTNPVGGKVVRITEPTSLEF